MAHYNVQPGKMVGCSDVIQGLIHEFCMVSKLSDKKLANHIEKLHNIVLKGIRKLEQEIWKEVTGTDEHSTSFTLSRHKLFFNYMFYNILSLPGSTQLAEKIDRVKEKRMWIIKKMKNGLWDKITNRQWALLKPHLCQYPQERLMSCLKMTLRDCEMNPSDGIEERDFQLIHLLFERHVQYYYLFNLLLLLDDADLPLLIQFVDRIKNLKSNASIQAEVNLLPIRYKKCLKLILLLFHRYSEFRVSYADNTPLQLKCLECIPDNYEVDTTFVICEFCREMLVYRDMRKRPASFGVYLQTEHMEKRCYRDDSDQLQCIYCFKRDKYISLIFSHPDRNDVGLCQGRRSCFRSVGFKNRKCTKCIGKLDDFQIHQDTCLIKRKDNLCKTCKIVLLSLDGIIPEEKEKDKADKICKEKTIPRKKNFTLVLMEQAAALAERRKLIK